MQPALAILHSAPLPFLLRNEDLSMIGYITLGSNNIETSGRFYDQIFDLIGAKRIYSFDSYIAWSAGEGEPFFSITSPFDGKRASVGNGTMIALSAPNKELVAKLHLTALELGAACEGPPGPRDGGFFCAYFRDLDGNKLNVHCRD